MSTVTAAIVDSLPESGYSQKMTAAEEQQLLERIRAGDDSGFEQLVREHTGKVIGLAWRLLGSREEAEDLAQEAFDAFVDEAKKQYPDAKCLQEAETMLVIGLPVNRILEMVDITKASTVVMGSQGRTGMKHIMLGSKAEQVVRLCPVPIMIVKEPVKHSV